jgi:peptidoglycan/LPS O-acetylase OafA/YrhL
VTVTRDPRAAARDRARTVTGPPAPGSGPGQGSGSVATAPGREPAGRAARRIRARPAARRDPRPDTTPSLRYQGGIDGLRALSVIAVLLYHAEVTGTPTGVTGGYLGVEVFFVVSGYLITSLLLKERRDTGRVDLRHFWARRARRLLPALFVLLGAVTAYTLLFLSDAVERLKGDVLAALLYVSNWWQIVSDQSYFEAAGREPVLRHLWSLAVEEQFYLLWPVVLTFALTRFARPRVMLGILGVALASTAWMAFLYTPYDPDPTRVYVATDTRLSGLLLGALLAFVWAPYRFRARPARSAGATMSAAGLLGLAVLGWSFLEITDFEPFVYRGGFLLVDLATVLVIAAAVFPTARLGRVLGMRPLVWVGLRSYGIYLWHWPIFAITRPETDVPLSGRPLLILRLALTFLAAELSFRYVEMPIRHGAIGTYFGRVRASRGDARVQLLGRAAFVAGALTAGALLLGIGLVNATGDPVDAAAGRTAVFAEQQQAAGDDDPGEPVAAALTSTSVAGGAPGTSPVPTVGGDTSPGNGDGPGTPSVTAPATTSPTTTSPPNLAAGEVDGNRVLALGDSVMLGATPELQAAMPGILVDAKVSRSFVNAIEVLTWYREHDLLRDVVVVHMGTNGAFSDEQFEQMMDVLGDERIVVFVNARVPRSWQGLVNERLAAGVERHDNAVLFDWFGYGGPHDDWFASDGFHLERVGAEGYTAELESTIARSLRRQARDAGGGG